MLEKIMRRLFPSQSTKNNTNANIRYTDNNKRLSTSLDDNVSALKNIFGNSSDLIIKTFYFGDTRQVKATLFFIEGLINQKIILDNVIKSLMVDVHIIDRQGNYLNQNGAGLFETIKKHLLNTVDAADVRMTDDAVNSIVSGDVCLLIDGLNVGLTIDAKGGDKRSIEKPENEIGIRGPQASFVETLRTNTTLLRRIIKNPNLIFENLILGQKTHTNICLAYLRGVADEKIIKEVHRRLSRIDIDSVLGAGYIEQLIEDSHRSPFATIGNSERPDKVAAKILEGRVAILCDGTPVVLTVPYMFIEAFQVPDDYYSRIFYVNIMRWVRVLGFMITLTVPAIFVAITTFHQEMIPTVLLIKITAAREGVPFPVLIEALISETIFLLMRESGVRMPRATGSAVTIVGTLVMGDAAVTAGLIGAPMVIVTSLTAITGFIVPALYNSILVFRFLLLILGGCFSLFGVVIGMLCMLAHMCALRSFGTPYMAPLAPIIWKDLKDSVVRMPMRMMKWRPRSVTWKKSKRMANTGKNDPRRR